MRIIGGERRGHRLVEWHAAGIRPLRDRVRASLFDTLGELVVDTDFLDLFAGTGAVGLEALSRGARRATFVDSSGKAIRIIRANLRKLRYEDRAEVMKADVREAIVGLWRRGRRFDLVFMGAPYSQGLTQEALEWLAAYPILREGGLVIAEVHRSEELKPRYGSLRLIRDRDYGDSRLLFFEFAPSIDNT
ncbi:16S rRNA (guanine(966)-N(2))-methyltransferase RsmD [Candidatus Bipolaricaulota sp. J31]